jgi:hypothetical protein
VVAETANLFLPTGIYAASSIMPWRNSAWRA